MKHRVYLEEGARRVFACAVDWPGWARSGKGADEALEALAGYGDRYAGALGRRRAGFEAPVGAGSFTVAERVRGNATTDFGAPGVPTKLDKRPVKPGELHRQLRLLEACWGAFDRTAEAAAGMDLAKGPRGGGRDLDAIVAHVVDAELAYLSGLGGAAPKDKRAAAVRRAVIQAVEARARGDPPARPRRSKKPLWPAPFAIRRVAWHALDHAWEIEDRVARPPP